MAPRGKFWFKFKVNQAEPGVAVPITATIVDEQKDEQIMTPEVLRTEFKKIIDTLVEEDEAENKQSPVFANQFTADSGKAYKTALESLQIVPFFMESDPEELDCCEDFNPRAAKSALQAFSELTDKVARATVQSRDVTQFSNNEHIKTLLSQSDRKRLRERLVGAAWGVIFGALIGMVVGAYIGYAPGSVHLGCILGVVTGAVVGGALGFYGAYHTSLMRYPPHPVFGVRNAARTVAKKIEQQKRTENGKKNVKGLGLLPGLN
ncbi:MAG TPA: hypothetical protein VLH77_01780 [Gammaproteobacteria bacterium]|nr:hypothetical protein [Gammaproteobacteria bacterium]